MVDTSPQTLASIETAARLLLEQGMLGAVEWVEGLGLGIYEKMSVNMALANYRFLIEMGRSDVVSLLAYGDRQ